MNLLPLNLSVLIWINTISILKSTTLAAAALVVKYFSLNKKLHKLGPTQQLLMFCMNFHYNLIIWRDTREKSKTRADAFTHFAGKLSYYHWHNEHSLNFSINSKNALFPLPTISSVLQKCIKTLLCHHNRDCLLSRELCMLCCGYKMQMPGEILWN